MKQLFTIGYSTRALDEFLSLLRENSVEVVCDVRSQPYSRINPPFSKDAIERELKRHNFQYVFMGKELGVRSDDKSLYIKGKVQYSLLAKTEAFKNGIGRLLEYTSNNNVAIMCAEKDPITCHRSILVCRNIKQEDISIKHILNAGHVETHAQLEDRLLDLYNLSGADLFMDYNDRLNQAFDQQAAKIAYTINEDSDEKAK